MFRYDHMARLYADRFEGRVHFLVYEHLSRDIARFVRDVCWLLGEEEVPSITNVNHNQSYGRYQFQLARVMNRFFTSPRNPDGIIPGFWIPGVGLRRFHQLLDHRWVHRVFKGWYKNKMTMPKEISTAIMEYFSSSNAEFEKKWHLGLDRLGYIVQGQQPIP